MHGTRNLGADVYFQTEHYGKEVPSHSNRSITWILFLEFWITINEFRLANFKNKKLKKINYEKIFKDKKSNSEEIKI